MRVRLSGSEKIEFFSNLYTLLRAGIPLLNGVESLLEDSKGNLKKVYFSLREDLLAGKRMYVTLSKFPDSFDRVTVNLIKAAEEAGTLETTLNDIKKTTQADIEFSDKVKSALTYPIFVLVVFVGVMLVMLFVVMPKISEVFGRLRVEIPLPTQILIALSNFITRNTIYVGMGSLVFVAFIVYLFRLKKRLIISFLSTLPVLSGLYKKIDIVRFARSMGLLLSSGIPIVNALELAIDVVSKRDLKNVLEKSKTMVYAGKQFSEGLEGQKKVIPPIVVKLIQIGEISGSLDKAMYDVTEYMDYEVSKSLKTLTTLLEPLMLVFVGILVGAIMISIISPMYNMISQVSNR